MKTNTSPSTVTCRGKLVLLAILAVACSLVAPMPCQAGTMKNVQATFAQSDAPGGTAGTIDGNYGLEGTMTIRFTGRIEISGIATTSDKFLVLDLQHPIDKSQDLHLVMHRQGNRFVSPAAVNRNHDWLLQLSDPARQWRLVGRLHRQSNSADLRASVRLP